MTGSVAMQQLGFVSMSTAHVTKGHADVCSLGAACGQADVGRLNRAGPARPCCSTGRAGPIPFQLVGIPTETVILPLPIINYTAFPFLSYKSHLSLHLYS